MPTSPLPPRTDPAVLSDGTVVTWPYEAQLTSASAALLTVPFDRAQAVVEHAGVHPVRVLPGRSAMLLVHVAYDVATPGTDGGPGAERAEEVLFYLPGWRGRGGSVAGLTWLLHGTFDRQVAGYGLHPLFCIASSEALARVRTEVWGFESRVARIRSVTRRGGAAVQVDSDRGLVLRMDLTTPTARVRNQTIGLPLHLDGAEGPRTDWGEMAFTDVRRRFRPGGHVEITGRGPLADLARILGTEDEPEDEATSVSGEGRHVRRTPLASLTATGGSLWFAGPRLESAGDA